MQTFQTAAVVGLIDNMSGPLKALSKQASELAKAFTGMGGGPAKRTDQQMSAAVAALKSANAEAKTHLSLMDRIANVKARPGAMVAGIAGGAIANKMKNELRQQMPTEKNVLETSSRLTDFTKVSPEDAADIRRQSRIEGVKVVGGQEGYMKEALGAAKMNMPPDLLNIAATRGQQFGDFMKMHAGEGIEKLINTAEYFDMFKNRRHERGTPASIHDENMKYGMTAEQSKADIDMRMKAAGAQYLKISNAMPGSEQSLFDAMKRAMPISQSLNVPLGDTVAMMSMLATAGLEGSLQGTLTRAVLTRGAAPSLVSQAAVTAAGADPRQFMKMDQTAMDPDGFVKGLAQFYGPVMKGSKGLTEELTADIAVFKHKPGTRSNKEYAELEEHIVSKIVEAGGKNNKGNDVYNSELVAKRVNKQLNLANTSYDVLAAIAFLKKEGKFTAGLAKAMFGTEGSTAVLGMAGQDIEDARKRGNALTTESTPELAASWDKDMKQRADSSFNAIEGSTRRVSSLFDSLYEHVQPLIDATAKEANKALDSAINAKPDEKTAQIVAAAGVGAGSVGAGLVGAGMWTGAAVLGALGTPLIVAGATVAGTAAAYLAIKALSQPDDPSLPDQRDAKDVNDKRRRSHPFGWVDPNPMDETKKPLPEGWRDPVWKPPAEWPQAGSGQAVQNTGPMVAAAPAAPVSVVGTLTGETTVATTVAVTLNPSPYFTALVAKAEAAGRQNVTGKLGTGLAGDGNATKSSQPARTGASGAW
jgi:hypothetical protein